MTGYVPSRAASDYQEIEVLPAGQLPTVTGSKQLASNRSSFPGVWRAGMMRYLDQTATVTAIVVAILLTDHLFSPVGTTVKQLAVARAQLVQKPCALSLHVPALLLSDSARGSRVIFPSGVKVILNLTPLSVAAVKGWPLKNVAWMSLGAMGSAAKAMLAWKSIVATTNGSARIEPRGSSLASALRAKRFSKQATHKLSFHPRPSFFSPRCGVAMYQLPVRSTSTPQSLHSGL